MTDGSTLDVARKQPSRWLVLGASGFVGSAVVRRLHAAQMDVVSVPTPRVRADRAEGVRGLASLACSHPALHPLVTAMDGVAVVVMAGGRADPSSPWSAELVGANALAPALVARAATLAGVRRLIHISSAAVQGRRLVLTEDTSVAGFSPYSSSKILGEQLVIAMTETGAPEAVILRATSVQGRGRRTTEALRRVARSPLASVAGSGNQPSAASSVDALAALVLHVGQEPAVPKIVLQPWEGLSVAEVLRWSSGREPRHLPISFCRVVLTAGHLISRGFGGRGAGSVRRVEAMWFGQSVEAAWAFDTGFRVPDVLTDVLAGGHR